MWQAHLNIWQARQSNLVRTHSDCHVRRHVCQFGPIEAHNARLGRGYEIVQVTKLHSPREVCHHVITRSAGAAVKKLLQMPNFDEEEFLILRRRAQKALFV
jgi:hypothetical protein